MLALHPLNIIVVNVFDYSEIEHEREFMYVRSLLNRQILISAQIKTM